MVTGTPTEITFQSMANFIFTGIAVIFKKIGTSHNHSRGTKTTLQTMFFLESFLQGMELTILAHAFNSGNISPIRLNRKHGTRFHRLAIHMDSACTTGTGITAHMGASQSQFFPDVINKKDTWIYRVIVGFSVYVYLDIVSHSSSLF
jgi:hypothetical protein